MIAIVFIHQSGPEVIKLLSCSTQLSRKFQPLIKIIMLKNEDFSCFQAHRCSIIMLINVKMPSVSELFHDKLLAF